MHTSQNFHEFFGITLGNGPDGSEIFRLGVFNEIIRIFTALFIERIARAHIFEFHCSTNIACTELVDLRTNLAAHTVNLSYALLALAAHVVQIHAGRQSAAHHLEVAHFADMRLHRCLEHIKTKRSVAVGLHFFAGGIDRCRHILDKRHHVSKEFHHAPHTHVFHGAHAENRIDRPIHQSLTDTFAHFIL